jgi:hypothetical protein
VQAAYLFRCDGFVVDKIAKALPGIISAPLITTFYTQGHLALPIFLLVTA